MEGAVYKNVPLQGEKNATLLNIASAPVNLDPDINKTEKCFLSVKEGVGRATSLRRYRL